MEVPTSIVDYPLLRKMSSLSQISQPSRSSRRSPNTSLSRRARIMKPASASNSPCRLQQHRRRTPTVMTRPVTFHAQQLNSYQQAPTLMDQGAAPHPGALPPTYDHRPVTWHPAFEGSGSYGSGNMYTHYVPGYQNTIGAYGFENQTYPTGFEYSQIMNASSIPVQAPPSSSSSSQQWHPNNTSWFDSSNQECMDGNSLPLDSLNLNQMPSSTGYQETCQNAEANEVPNTSSNYTNGLTTYANFDADEDNDDEDELVGMGLHDKSTNFEQPSLLLGAGLDEHEKPSPSVSPETKHLSLSSDPSLLEQVPDAIPDEGNDTPVTNDFQDFSSPFHPATYTPYDMALPISFPEQLNQPQMYDLSGQSFFFDDGNDAGGNQWYQTQGKAPPMQDMGMTMGMTGMQEWGWTVPQDGY